MDNRPIPEGLLRTPEGFYVLRDDSHLSRWIENHHRLDVAEGQINFFSYFIRPGSVVVDAGASLGDHTMTYAKLVGPTGRVVAIEPNPIAFAALRLNFEEWKTVAPFNYALSDIEGTTWFVKEANAGASHVDPTRNGFLVPCTTLDWLMAGAGQLDFIHFDLEGYELKALRGASELIAKFKPAIVVEINHACLARNKTNEIELIQQLDQMGYGIHELEPHLNSSFPQRDVLCLHHDHTA